MVQDGWECLGRLLADALKVHVEHGRLVADLDLMDKVAVGLVDLLGSLLFLPGRQWDRGRGRMVDRKPVLLFLLRFLVGRRFHRTLEQCLVGLLDLIGKDGVVLGHRKRGVLARKVDHALILADHRVFPLQRVNLVLEARALAVQGRHRFLPQIGRFLIPDPVGQPALQDLPAWKAVEQWLHRVICMAKEQSNVVLNLPVHLAQSLPGLLNFLQKTIRRLDLFCLFNHLATDVRIH